MPRTGIWIQRQIYTPSAGNQCLNELKKCSKNAVSSERDRLRLRTKKVVEKSFGKRVSFGSDLPAAYKTNAEIRSVCGYFFGGIENAFFSKKIVHRATSHPIQNQTATISTNNTQSITCLNFTTFDVYCLHGLENLEENENILFNRKEFFNEETRNQAHY